MPRWLPVDRAVRVGAVACLLMLAAGLPASAASAIRTIDGALLEVWETRSEPGDPISVPGGSGIFYSLSDESGTRFGVVGPRDPDSQDTSPVLVLERSEGRPVVVWSRFDGVSLKIAYARFEDDDWRDFHYLTFGTSQDTEPRIGMASTGDYLFWVRDSSRYMYAPLDLTGGQLLAAPREIRVRFRTDLQSSSPLGGTLLSSGVQGATDIPTILGRCDRMLEPCDGSSSIIRRSPGPTVTIDGGTDVPVILGATSTVWSVGSMRECATQVLVRPSRNFLNIEVLSFNNGRIEMLDQFEMPGRMRDDYAATTAATYLTNLCN